MRYYKQKNHTKQILVLTIIKMDDAKKVEASDIFSMSFHAVDVILWDWKEDRCDALALYIQCIYLDSHWLPLDDLIRDKDRFNRAKDILIHLWLIKIIRDDFENKDYVDTYYLV